LNTTRRTVAPSGPPDTELCLERHRPLQGLTWRLFGGFVAVILTLSLAGAAQFAVKADGDDLRRVESRTYEMEKTLTTLRTQLAEIAATQRDMRDDVTYIRKVLDEEKKK